MKTGGEVGDGRYLAGAADLEEDSAKLRHGAGGGELVGDGPARGFAGEAEAALLGCGVYLDDDSVDRVGERLPFLLGTAQ